MECGLDALLQPSPCPKINSAPPHSLDFLKTPRDLGKAGPPAVVDLQLILKSQQQEQEKQKHVLSEISEDVKSLFERVDEMEFKQSLILQTLEAGAQQQQQRTEDRPSLTSSADETSGVALEFSAALGVEVGALRNCLEDQRKQHESVIQSLQAQLRRLEQQLWRVPSTASSTDLRGSPAPQSHLGSQSPHSSVVHRMVSAPDGAPLQVPEAVVVSQAEVKQDSTPLDLLRKGLLNTVRGGSVEIDRLTVSQPVHREKLHRSPSPDPLAVSQPVPFMYSQGSSSTLSSSSPRIGSAPRSHSSTAVKVTRGGPNCATRRSPR